MDDKIMEGLDIKVDVNAKSVNEYVAKAILESKLGEEIKKAVDKYMAGDLYRSSFENALTETMDKVVRERITKLIDTEYGKYIEEEIKKGISEESVRDISRKAWEYLVNRF